MLGKPFALAFVIAHMPFDIAFHPTGLIQRTLDDGGLFGTAEPFEWRQQAVAVGEPGIGGTVEGGEILVVFVEIFGKIVFFTAILLAQ